MPRHHHSLFRSNTPVNAPAPTSHRRADTPAPEHRCANALMHLNHPFPPSLEPTNKHPSTAPVPLLRIQRVTTSPLLWPAHPTATPTIFATSLLPPHDAYKRTPAQHPQFYSNFNSSAASASSPLLPFFLFVVQNIFRYRLVLLHIHSSHV